MATWREKCGSEPFSNNRTHYGRRLKILLPFNERTKKEVHPKPYMARLAKLLVDHGYTNISMKLKTVTMAGRGMYPAVVVRLLFDWSNPANSKM